MYLKQKVKNIIKDAFYYSGLAGLTLCSARDKLCILCYHRVIGAGDGFRYLGIPQDMFERQILFLKKRFRILPLAEAVSILKNGLIKEPILALTFDDGYRDNYDNAFPVLKRHGITGTIFLTADFIGTEKRFWWDRLADMVFDAKEINRSPDEKIEIIESMVSSLRKRNAQEIENEIEKLKEIFGFKEREKNGAELLGWEEVREMDRYGMAFGSHTLTHPDLTLLSGEDIEKEAAQSKKIIERNIDKEISAFCYPYGFYNEAVKNAVKNAGYSCARSISSGFNGNSEDVFALRRIDGFSYRLSHFAARLSFGAIK